MQATLMKISKTLKHFSLHISFFFFLDHEMTSPKHDQLPHQTGYFEMAANGENTTQTSNGPPQYEALAELEATTTARGKLQSCDIW
jgi:hypothetical protein